jgi:hypothetical protein
MTRMPCADSRGIRGAGCACEFADLEQAGRAVQTKDARHERMLKALRGERRYQTKKRSLRPNA